MKPVRSFVVLLVMGMGLVSQSSNLDTIGLTLLRQVDPTLNGNGVRVAQVEGSYLVVNAFEVSPAVVAQPVGLFTYYSSSGTAATFPNAVGTQSPHADSVAGNFYGNTGFGVATNISHVDNYEAASFFNTRIGPASPVQIPAVVVNQSFVRSDLPTSAVDPDYDNFTFNKKTLFVNGAGNGGSVSTNPPATSFNGITVGVTDGASAVGPTADGRSKPDITCPGSGATSFSTPQVSGAAAILIQAARRGDAGAGSAVVATNPITIKALLLNGALKPAGWTNGPVTPLDARYGAGVLNVFNSWRQLSGGLHASNETTTVTTGNPHPPGSATNNQPSLSGWDHAPVSTTASQDKAVHYYFNLTNEAAFTGTATLVWNLQNNRTAANNLDLFLYNTGNGALVLSSTSSVDNVEHLFIPKLSPGRYDLQVLKRGSGQVVSSETYALAYEFFSLNLKCARSNGYATLSWTNYPTGFQLMSASSLNAPAVWAPVTAAVTMSNGQNFVSVPIAGASQFFRLQRP
ncbi:MAG: S8 family serine peptidase [Verrucomicrobiota bacterium]